MRNVLISFLVVLGIAATIYKYPDFVESRYFETLTPSDNSLTAPYPGYDRGKIYVWDCITEGECGELRDLWVKWLPAGQLEWIVIVFLVLVVYMFPTIVALLRGHHNKGAIAILNAFLGWTFLGWVGALVWAATQVKHTANG